MDGKKKPLKAIHMTIVLNCLWQIISLPVFTISVIITSWEKKSKRLCQNLFI